MFSAFVFMKNQKGISGASVQMPLNLKKQFDKIKKIILKQNLSGSCPGKLNIDGEVILAGAGRIILFDRHSPTRLAKKSYNNRRISVNIRKFENCMIKTRKFFNIIIDDLKCS